MEAIEEIQRSSCSRCEKEAASEEETGGGKEVASAADSVYCVICAKKEGASGFVVGISVGKGDIIGAYFGGGWKRTRRGSGL